MKIRFISIILKIIFDRRWGEELGAISEKITEFNGKVINDIQNEYNKIQFNNANRNQKLNFNYLYHCFEFSNNLVKARVNGNRGYILYFVDKYKIKMPFWINY